MADGPTARQRAAINCVDTLDITRPDVKFIPVRFVHGSAIDADGKRRIEFWLRVVFSALIDANRLDLNRGFRRRERRAHTVTGALERESAVRIDRRAQHLVMDGERVPHPLSVCLPPTGKTLNIGEQKRHDPPRRAHRRRMSHRALFNVDNRD
jgi:hypothetical protein